jgi:hypothetical protein
MGTDTECALDMQACCPSWNGALLISVVCTDQHQQPPWPRDTISMTATPVGDLHTHCVHCQMAALSRYWNMAGILVTMFHFVSKLPLGCSLVLQKQRLLYIWHLFARVCKQMAFSLMSVGNVTIQNVSDFVFMTGFILWYFGLWRHIVW